jgi:hypothetical protein
MSRLAASKANTAACSAEVSPASAPGRSEAITPERAARRVVQ